MKYLFEDKAEDSLSRLLRLSLPESMQSQLEYANGNGNLVRKAEELLLNGETVVVVLDTVPANKSIRDIYIVLRRLSRLYDYRLIIWNIFCAEYYFIKAFGRNERLRVFGKDIDYDVVVNVRPYKESLLILTDDDKAFTKTFEKFCKLYIMKNGSECVVSDTLFFDKDCRCDSDCEKETLEEKSSQYQKAYEFQFKVQPDTETLWRIHRDLLEITNQAIETYNQAGYLKIKPYPVVK